MPVRLPPLSRRRFIQGVLAGAGGMALGRRWALAADAATVAVDPNRLALLSDPHVHARRGFVARTANMWDNFARASEEIVALSPPPAAALINGDVAFASGRAEDYATVIQALKPLRTAGLSVHCALGNHDDRTNFLVALPTDGRRVNTVANKCVSVVRLPHCDWYLLDTLDQVNVTPGRLGPEQLAWLAKSLDASDDRPAVVMMHHQPDARELKKRSGLTDTELLLALLKPRNQVKALVYGHTHAWLHHEEDGLHFINLPTTAYVFKPEQPAGWVDARTTPKGMTLELRSLTPNHPQQNESVEFAWR